LFCKSSVRVRYSVEAVSSDLVQLRGLATFPVESPDDHRAESFLTAPPRSRSSALSARRSDRRQDCVARILGLIRVLPSRWYPRRRSAAPSPRCSGFRNARWPKTVKTRARILAYARSGSTLVRAPALDSRKKRRRGKWVTGRSVLVSSVVRLSLFVREWRR
jgi:hypothetical protein